MNLELFLACKRNWDDTATGELYADAVFQCFTLEDRVRDLGPHGEGKIQDQTAIPAGRYRVIINRSKRFKKDMMRLVGVPFFDGILIHGGNTDENTRGCILVGDKLEGKEIVHGTSTPAIRALFAKVQKFITDGGEVWITVSRDEMEEVA